MPRLPLLVRDAEPNDAQALATLWSRAGYPVDVSAIDSGEPERAIGAVLVDPDQRIVVGEYDGCVVAAVHLRRGPISPLSHEDAVHTSYLAVHPDHRRHGHAHQLLEAAVAWAEEKDTTRITAMTVSDSRESNRFLARLGLGTVATVRVTSTAALRMRLTPRASRTRAIGHVLAERRLVRRRSDARAAR